MAGKQDGGVTSKGHLPCVDARSVSTQSSEFGQPPRLTDEMTESKSVREPLAASLPEPGKAQNQDYHASCAFGPDSNPTHLLVVADGVSSSPLAARAARVACEAIIAGSELLVGLGPAELGTRLEELTRHANAAIREACQGKGWASLVAAVVQPLSKVLYVVSVGDSGIYLSEPADFRILTRPDRAVRVRKGGGRVLIKDGIPIIDRHQRHNQD